MTCDEIWWAGAVNGRHQCDVPFVDLPGGSFRVVLVCRFCYPAVVGSSVFFFSVTPGANSTIITNNTAQIAPKEMIIIMETSKGAWLTEVIAVLVTDSAYSKITHFRRTLVCSWGLPLSWMTTESSHSVWEQIPCLRWYGCHMIVDQLQRYSPPLPATMEQLSSAFTRVSVNCPNSCDMKAAFSLWGWRFLPCYCAVQAL